MISDSVRSGLPPLAPDVPVTTARGFEASQSNASGSTAALLPPSGGLGAKTFGRSVTSAGESGNDTRSNALPAITGRCAMSFPPVVSSDVQSAASPTPSLAATRGARSLPIEDALNSTSFGDTAFTAASTAAA
jgi:hypothetical protein